MKELRTGRTYCKFYPDFQLHGGLVPLTSMVFKGQLYK